MHSSRIASPVLIWSCSSFGSGSTMMGVMPLAETPADGVQMRGGRHIEGIVFRPSDGAVRHAAGKAISHVKSGVERKYSVSSIEFLQNWQIVSAFRNIRSRQIGDPPV